MTVQTKNSVLIISTIIILLGSLIIFYLFIIDGAFTPILDITDLHTVKKVYMRGEPVSIVSTFCKSKTSPALVQWQLMDHTVTTFSPDTHISTKVGCFKDFVSTPVSIPINALPGEYYLQNTLVYEINPVKDVTYVLRTNTFIVK